MSGAILVTGAAGYIGAALARQLLERGERVIGVDDFNDYYDAGVRAIRDLQPMQPGDVCHRDGYRRHSARSGPSPRAPLDVGVPRFREYHKR